MPVFDDIIKATNNYSFYVLFVNFFLSRAKLFHFINDNGWYKKHEYNQNFGCQLEILMLLQTYVQRD